MTFNSSLMVFFVFMVGCSYSGDIAKLDLVNTDSTSLVCEIGTGSWPSRWLYFAPSKKSGMRAYDEDVYESMVSVTLLNEGEHSFDVLFLGGTYCILPGEALTLKEIKFSDMRLCIAPINARKAKLRLNLVFDSAYTTVGSWRLMDAWSDGP